MRLDLSELDRSNFILSISGLFPSKIIFEGRYAQGRPYRAHEPGTFVWVDRYGLDCGEIHWQFKGQNIKSVDRREDVLLIYLSEKPKLMKPIPTWEDMADKLSPGWAERT